MALSVMGNFAQGLGPRPDVVFVGASEERRGESYITWSTRWWSSLFIRAE